jgi:TolA-binding protein
MKKLFRICSGVALLGLFVGVAQPAAFGREPGVPESRAQSAASDADDQYLFATELFGKKMYELAIQQYEKFLAEHRGHAKAFQARLRVAEANLRLGRNDRAIKAYEAALATRPDTAFRGEALVGLGVALFNAKEYDRAADALAEARPLVGEDKTLGPVAANWLGESLFQMGRYSGAARAYEWVLRWPASPHAPQALYALGYCQLKQGQTEAAVGTFRRLAKEYPQSPLAGTALTRAGETLLREKKYDEAESLFQSARKEIGGKLPATKAQRAVLADADWGLAGVALARRQYGEARERYLAYQRDHSSSPHAPEAALRIADCFYNEQKYAEAAKAYVAAAEAASRPDRGAAGAPSGAESRREAAYWEAMSRWKAGDRDGAAAGFRALAAAGESGSHAQRARLRLGELEAGRGLHDAAANAYREAIAADPEGPEAASASYALAALLYRQKKYQEAEHGFDAFLKRYPKHTQSPAARLAIGQCRWQRREFGGARDSLEAAIASGLKGETHAGALLLLGRCHARLGADAKAETAWKAVVETYPKSGAAPRALAALADWYAETGRTEEAERARKELGERYPSAPATVASRLRAGDVELRKGKPEAAIRHYQAALAAEPAAADALPIRLSLAAAALRAEKPELALAECRKVLDASPESAAADQARLLMASAHAKQGRSPEAAALYRAVADREPKTARAAAALLRLGRLQSDAKQHAEAQATLERLLKEHPESSLVPEALYELAWARDESGDRAAATATWERLLKEFPTHALAAEAAFRLGEGAYAARRYEDAAGYYRRAAEGRLPADATDAGDKAWYKLGWSHRQLGRHDAAAAAFRKLYTLYPKSELALEGRLRAAEAHSEQGHVSEARALFAAVIREGEKTTDGADHVLRARLGLALARLKNGEQADGPLPAALADLKALARTANGHVGAEAQFRVGEALLARREYARAAEEFLRVTLLFKGYPTWAAPAQFQLGESYSAMGNAREAKAAYRRCVESYAGSRWAELSRQRLAAPGKAGGRQALDVVH